MELTTYLVSVPTPYTSERNLGIASTYDGYFAQIILVEDLRTFFRAYPRPLANRTLVDTAHRAGWTIIAKLCTVEITQHPIETSHVLKTTALNVAKSKYPEYLI